MNVEDSLSKQIKCCISKIGDHYAYDAVLLSCSGNACKKCIENLSDLKVKCKYCLQEHEKIEMLKGPSNQPNVKLLIQMCLKDLGIDLKEELKEAVDSFKEDKIDHEIDLRFENIAYEIEARIESIIAEIHKYRSEFMIELKHMKDEFKRSVMDKDHLNEMNLISSSSINCHASSYDEFMEIQEKIKQSKHLLDGFMNEINKFKFVSKEDPLEKSIIGYFEKPGIKKIKSSYEININDATLMQQFIHMKAKDKIIATDYKKGCLFLIDLNQRSNDMFQHDKIKHPCAICCGKDDKILITDHNKSHRSSPEPEEFKVLVFSADMIFERGFKVRNGSSFNRMKVDLFNEDETLLYITHLEENKVTIWNYLTGVCVNSFKVDSPNFIEFTNEHIFIESYTTYNSEGRILKNIDIGSNCIFVLNKTNYEIVNKIGSDNWLFPWGLCLDQKHLNIMTTARELNESKFISKSKFLYIFDEKGCLKSKSELQEDLFQGSSDIIYFDNKFIKLYSKSIHTIELFE